MRPATTAVLVTLVVIGTTALAEGQTLSQTLADALIPSQAQAGPAQPVSSASRLGRPPGYSDLVDGFRVMRDDGPDLDGQFILEE